MITTSKHSGFLPRLPLPFLLWVQNTDTTPSNKHQATQDGAFFPPLLCTIISFFLQAGFPPCVVVSVCVCALTRVPVCMRVCVGACARVFPYLPPCVCLWVCVWVCVCVNARVYGCLCVCVCACVSVGLCVSVWVCVCKRVRVCVGVRVCVCILVSGCEFVTTPLVRKVVISYLRKLTRAMTTKGPESKTTSSRETRKKVSPAANPGNPIPDETLTLKVQPRKDFKNSPLTEIYGLEKHMVGVGFINHFNDRNRKVSFNHA